MKTYELTWHYRYIILPLIILAATATCVGYLSYLIPFLFSGDLINIIGSLFDFAIVIVAALLWYMAAVVPYKVAIRSDGRIGFRSILRQHIILASQVYRIEHRMFTSKISHSNGRIYLSNLMDGQSSIIASIKEKNPEVVIINST